MDNVYSREAPHLYRGIVESNEDPENLGRCRVRVPSIHGDLTYSIEALPWARPLVFSPVSKNKGSIHIPDKGDIVWVLFEGAVREFPVYFGGTYARGELPVNNREIDFYIEDDTRISYDRDSKEYIVKSGDMQVSVSPTNISLKGDTKIKGNLSIEGTTKIEGDLRVVGTATVDKLIVLDQ